MAEHSWTKVITEFIFTTSKNCQELIINVNDPVIKIWYVAYSSDIHCHRSDIWFYAFSRKCLFILNKWERAVTQVIQALCYKPKGHGIYSRWGHCNSIDTILYFLICRWCLYLTGDIRLHCLLTEISFLFMCRWYSYLTESTGLHRLLRG
jgi:hypothetical protein